MAPMPTDNKIRAMALEERAGKSSKYYTDALEAMDMDGAQMRRWGGASGPSSSSPSNNGHSHSHSNGGDDTPDFLSVEEMEDEFSEVTDKHNKWSNFFANNRLENEVGPQRHRPQRPVEKALSQAKNRHMRNMALAGTILAVFLVMTGLVVSGKVDMSPSNSASASATVSILGPSPTPILPTEPPQPQGITFHDLVEYCQTNPSFDASWLDDTVVERRGTVLLHLHNDLGDTGLPDTLWDADINSCDPVNLGLLYVSLEPYVRNFGTARLRNRFVLAALYVATQGNNWKTQTNWLTESDECSWHGIDCIRQRIVEIKLPKNQMRGTLPEALYLLTDLMTLEIPRNGIEGTLSSKVGNLRMLSTAFLNSNLFRGPLPATIGSLQNLGVLNLQNNTFTGRIPPEIGDLNPETMKSLGMGDNEFDGSVPSEIFQLTNLVRLEMNDLGEFVRGSLPDTIGQLSFLETLDAEEVVLTGTVPTEIGLCSSLKIFNVPSNHLQGALPTELGALKNLEYIDLEMNDFTVPLPDEVCAIADDIPNFNAGSDSCDFKSA